MRFIARCVFLPALGLSVVLLPLAIVFKSDTLLMLLVVTSLVWGGIGVAGLVWESARGVAEYAAALGRFLKKVVR